MSEAIRISGCLICKNGGWRIVHALDSLAWCDEIVVVDSGSTDNTVAVCEGHSSGKVRVMFHEWEGFNLQRKFAAEQCRNDWVLMLDSDEECSEQLREELQGLAEKGAERVGGVAIFKMPRNNYLAKRLVRCWGPDFQTRFVHKGRVEWDPRSVPEIRTAKAGFGVRKLKGAILHNRLTPYHGAEFNDGARQQMYAEELARHMQLKGKRATWVQLAFRPMMTFIKYYILRGAFLDGRFGLAIAYKTTIGVMQKYSVLYGKELEEKG